MNKKEISEIKKFFTKEHCCIHHLCGCYVDENKVKRLEFADAFLSLPEEESFKYFDLFRKALSGGLGRNLLNMDFPYEEEYDGGHQAFLLKLLNSSCQDPALLDDFYDQVIASFLYPEHYLILIAEGSYDIPQKATDGTEMFDASEYVYHYIMTAICPVRLSKPGLCINADVSRVEDRIRDWIVEAPEIGFLFPAYNDRNTDLHSLLFYSKNAELPNADTAGALLGCVAPAPAKAQKETFNEAVEEVLGNECTFEAVRTIHSQLSDLIEERKDSPDPVALDQADIRRIISSTGTDEDPTEAVQSCFERTVGEKSSILASNLAAARRFEVKTPDVTVQVRPEQMDLIETRVIDGRSFLLIPLEGEVTVNGIHIQPEATTQE